MIKILKFFLFIYLIYSFSCSSKVTLMSKEEWLQVHKIVQSEKSLDNLLLKNKKRLYLMLYNKDVNDCDSCYKYYSFEKEDKDEILKLTLNPKELKFWYYIK